MKKVTGKQSLLFRYNEIIQQRTHGFRNGGFVWNALLAIALLAVSVSGQARNGMGFSEQSTTHVITGVVTNGTDPLAGISVRATGGHQQTVTTNAAGQFTLTNVADGASLAIAPSFSNYSFLPTSITLNNITQNLSGFDFIAVIPGQGSVNGRILDPSGHPVAGVVLVATEDHKQTVVSNHSGYYQFNDIGTGGKRFDITPEKPGYQFDPVFITVDKAFNPGQGWHLFNQSFTALPGVLPYFSRQTGPWSDPATWSLSGHSGPAAPQIPGLADDAIIGEGHIVTLTANVLNESGLISVNPAGTLVTNQFVVSGEGNFALNAGGTLHIGSSEGILASGIGGSVRTSGRSFSTGASYVYDGNQAQQTGSGLPSEVFRLRIDNPSGVSAPGCLKVSDLLALDNGLLIMPPGHSLAAAATSRLNGNVRMQLTLSGDKGWRLISSPVATTYDDLLNGFVSQGFGGTANPELQPNIMWFDETETGTTNMAWRAPSAISSDVQGGRGFFFYVFNGAGGEYPDVLPITMDATGLEYVSGASSFNFGVTRTLRASAQANEAEQNELNEGWNLVGNPTTATLDWNASGGWIRSNIDQSIYIWDPSANNGFGAYLYWNGTTGTLGNGLIAPFQAFWIRADNHLPVLAMNAAAKTTGGTYAGNPAANKSADPGDPGAFRLQLESHGMEATAFLLFSHDGRTGKDRKDAYQLEALNDSWLKLYTTSAENPLPMVINHLPEQFGEIMHIPLYAAGQLEGKSAGGNYKLRWRLPDNWPANREAYLMDHHNKTSIPMHASANEVTFYLPPDESKASSMEKTKSQPDLPATIVKNIAPGAGAAIRTGEPDKRKASNAGQISETRTIAVGQAPRFSIVVFASQPSGEVDYMPAESLLYPVFPNPVTGSASIRFNLPASEHVRIELYDLQGRLVRTLADQLFDTGIHSLNWTPESLPPGIYLAIMRTESQLFNQKLILMR